MSITGNSSTGNSNRFTQRTVRRFPLVPPREPKKFRGEWSLEWINSEEDQQKSLNKILLESEIITLHFHLNELSGGWGLLEVGLPTQKHTLLIDGTESDSENHLSILLQSSDCQIVVFDVVKLCPALLRLGISPEQIFDIHMRATHHFPWSRDSGMIELSEQILGVGIQNRSDRYDWNSRPLSFEQIQISGIGAELCFHLYNHLVNSERSIQSDSESSLTLVK